MASIARPSRPVSLIVLAVCQFVVGGLGVFYEVFKCGGSLLFLLSPSMLKAAMNANPVLDITLQAPFFLETQAAASLFGLVLSVVLIADGVGLLLLRRWAYNLGVLYGWLSIAYQVFWMAYLLFVALPVIMAGLDNLPLPAGAPANANQGEVYRGTMKAAEIVDVVTTGIGLIYPIFVLIMLAFSWKAFRRPKLSRAGLEGVDDETGAAGAYTDDADEPTGYEPPADDRIGSGPLG